MNLSHNIFLVAKPGKHKECHKSATLGNIQETIYQKGDLH